MTTHGGREPLSNCSGGSSNYNQNLYHVIQQAQSWVRCVSKRTEAGSRRFSRPRSPQRPSQQQSAGSHPNVHRRVNGQTKRGLYVQRTTSDLKALGNLSHTTTRMTCEDLMRRQERCDPTHTRHLEEHVHRQRAGWGLGRGNELLTGDRVAVV